MTQQTRENLRNYFVRKMMEEERDCDKKKTFFSRLFTFNKFKRGSKRSI